MNGDLDEAQLCDKYRKVWQRCLHCQGKSSLKRCFMYDHTYLQWHRLCFNQRPSKSKICPLTYLFSFLFIVRVFQLWPSAWPRRGGFRLCGHRDHVSAMTLAFGKKRPDNCEVSNYHTILVNNKGLHRNTGLLDMFKDRIAMTRDIPSHGMSC